MNLETLINRLHTSDVVSHLHGKSAHEAAEYAAELFDLCIDQPGWDAKDYPFSPSKIRENFERGNLDATEDYDALLDFAAEKHHSSKEAILSIRKQECDWIIDDQD